MEKFSDNPQVQDWMSKLYTTLVEEIDIIPEGWMVQLQMLAQQMELYLKAKAEIDENGILIKDSRGGKVKNPAVSVLNATALTICKLVASFGLNRLAKSRIRENKDITNVQDFINSLSS